MWKKVNKHKWHVFAISIRYLINKVQKQKIQSNWITRNNEKTIHKTSKSNDVLQKSQSH